MPSHRSFQAEDKAWFLEHMLLGGVSLHEESSLVNAICLKGTSSGGVAFEVVIGVGLTVLDRWQMQHGRNVTLWSVSSSGGHLLRHSYGESTGPGWRNAMLDAIDRAICDGHSLKEIEHGDE